VLVRANLHTTDTEPRHPFGLEKTLFDRFSLCCYPYPRVSIEERRNPNWPSPYERKRVAEELGWLGP